MAYDADPTSLDSHEQFASATLQLSHLTFDPLLRFRKDLTLEPRLATSWEKIDDRTTRFHLREAVHFHSGRTFSVEDVVWTFNRLKKIKRILYNDAARVPLHWQHLSWAVAASVHIDPVLNVIDMPYLGDLVMD
jgi:ABC-type transport system substrate-binding protein